MYAMLFFSPCSALYLTLTWAITSNPGESGISGIGGSKRKGGRKKGFTEKNGMADCKQIV